MSLRRALFACPPGAVVAPDGRAGLRRAGTAARVGGMINAETADAMCSAFGLSEKDLMEALLRRQEAAFRKAVKEQALAAKAGGERLRMRHGEVTMSVHPFFYHWWGRRMGYECWDDAGFVRWWLNHHPECRVKSVAANATVSAGVLFGADGVRVA